MAGLSTKKFTPAKDAELSPVWDFPSLTVALMQLRFDEAQQWCDCQTWCPETPQQLWFPLLSERLVSTAAYVYSTVKYRFKVTKLSKVAFPDRSPFSWNGPGNVSGLIFLQPVLLSVQCLWREGLSHLPGTMAQVWGSEQSLKALCS